MVFPRVMCAALVAACWATAAHAAPPETWTETFSGGTMTVTVNHERKRMVADFTMSESYADNIRWAEQNAPDTMKMLIFQHLAKQMCGIPEVRRAMDYGYTVTQYVYDGGRVVDVAHVRRADCLRGH